jgi:alkaline phosphatase
MESHGGEDVALYANGPWSHLVGGVLEQNAIFHIIAHAFGWDGNNDN